MKMKPPNRSKNSKETEPIVEEADATTEAIRALPHIAKSLSGLEKDVEHIKGNLDNVNTRLNGVDENIQNINFKLGALTQSDREKSVKIKELNGELEPIRTLRTLIKAKKLIFLVLSAIIATIAGVIAALIDKGIF